MAGETKLICSSCDAVIEDGDKFCKNCGQPNQGSLGQKFCSSCGQKIEHGGSFCVECGQPLEASASTQDEEEDADFDSIVQTLGNRGEKLLSNNMTDNENVYVKLKGSFGEGFVVTDKRVYLLKWGFMTGNTFGGRCLVFDFRSITSIEIKKNLGTGSIEILTPATQNAQKSYWSQGNNSALKSDNVVTFQSPQFKNFQAGVNIARDIIAQ